MNAAEEVKRMLRAYGGRTVLHDVDGWHSHTFYALLQPLRYKNKMYLEGTYTPIGRSDRGYYLYTGPYDHDLTKLTDAAVVEAADARYTIDRAEKVFLNGVCVYVWAILRAVTEAPV